MIILASSSPRRRDLLKKAGISFMIDPSKYEEKIEFGLSPKELVISLAKGKAMEVFSRHKTDLIIGADTLVVLKNERLGKPKDKEDARRMLKDLSGKKHFVYTGIVLISGDRIVTDVVKSAVYFHKLTDEMIENYLCTDEPYDKAGSYAIQGQGSSFIKKIKGDYDNIVGLPTDLVVKYIKKLSV